MSPQTLHWRCLSSRGGTSPILLSAQEGSPALPSMAQLGALLLETELGPHRQLTSYVTAPSHAALHVSSWACLLYTSDAADD